MQIKIVKVLKDNYTYLVLDEPSRSCLIIDPPEVAPVEERMNALGYKAAAIWLTHHHNDHIAGVPGLLQLYPNLEVVCSRRDSARISSSTRSVSEGDRLEFAGHEARVLEVPGHAEGHIAFHFEKEHQLFCGDVIFGASCGAVFGDTHAEMYHSVSRISKLPPETEMWIGHEYTENNLRFAEAVLGEERLAQRKADFKVPSVPLLLETELETNAFMRLDSPEVLSYLGRESGDDQATFKALRLAKDSF